MTPNTSTQSRLASLLFWSIVSAAFIGPGTVTTASKAGASYGFALLWALLFSTLACIILQEAAARITIYSGLNLGEAIAIKFGAKRNNSIIIFIFLAIFIGGIAYQAGNVLGAVSGITLLFNINKIIVTCLISTMCAVLLWSGNYRLISKVLGAVVAIMGFSFCWIVLKMDVDWPSMFTGMLIPSIPKGAEWLVIGLIGTTIVPYNLFLGSGISHGQDVKNMRFGLVSAILIGGIISSAILIVGSLITGSFSFEKLRMAIDAQLGPIGGVLLGIGLLTAGFTSAVTAPLASAITSKSLFGKNNIKWQENGIYYKSIWLIVLISGLIFGISGVKPVPAIIIAQATNGLLLPVACIYLIFIINDEKLMTSNNKASLITNVLLAIVLLVTSFLGIFNSFKLITSSFKLPKDLIPIGYHFGAAMILTGFVFYKTLQKK